ncbi:MAG TPA: PHP domain-containing protein [Dehalococcoidia bacterium]|nr:PHP domain-containing protein [Dehalococcoidia bacterium]
MSAPRLIRADLHNHTYFSPDSILSPEEVVERVRRAGLNCIAITDHNTVRGGLAVREIADGFQVIVGEEVRTADGEILGLFLTEDVPRGLPARETVALIKAQGGIVGVPHPFDHLRSALNEAELEALIAVIDFIEALNSRIVFPVHNKLALEFARRHDKPVSAASDAHSPREVGRSYVEMPPFTGPGDFLESLRAGRLVGRLSSPLIHMISRYAKLRHALGWHPG